MTYASGPLQPLPLDGPGQRKRRLLTGAGIVAVAGIVVGGMALANRPPRQPVSAQAALGAVPSATATASAAASVPPSSTTAPAPGDPSGPATSAPAAVTPTSVDVDGDGRADSASVRFVSKRSAQVVVRLAGGKSLSSKAFDLYRQDTAGTVTPADVNGDGRFELLVTDPGADGTGYELFAYDKGALVELAAPKGQQQPFLYAGGGMYYQSAFACTGHQLVVAREQPVVRSTASLPPDPAFTVTTTAYSLHGSQLALAATHTETVANRAAAAAALSRTANACGAQP